MNTTDNNPIPATRMRAKRTYTQPADESIVIPALSRTAQDQADHVERLKRVLRSATPVTFQEYQQWLQDWRLAYRHEVKLAQDYRTARTRYKLAGGFGRRESNAPYKMTPKIEEAYDAAFKSLNGEGRAYQARVSLEMVRIGLKPLGKTLWEAQSQPKV